MVQCGTYLCHPFHSKNSSGAAGLNYHKGEPMSISEQVFTIKNPERFLKSIRIDTESNCWNWVGYIDKHSGYGRMSRQQEGKTKYYATHRVAYSIFKGDLTPGLVIDHCCKNRRCVNPEHLREVTIAINSTVNSDSVFAKNKAKTHCKRGHSFDLSNTGIDKKGRFCIRCKKDLEIIRRKNKKMMIIRRQLQ